MAEEKRVIKIKSIEDLISQLNKEGYSNVVKDASNRVILYVEKVSNTGNVFPGIGKRLTYIINKIENDELEGLEAINELQYYKETIDLYSNELENLLTFYESNFENTKSEEGSLLWKLNKIKEVERSIKNKYEEQINPLIAKELNKQVSVNANDSFSKELIGLKKREKEYIIHR